MQNCMLISFHHAFATDERADKHHQCGFGQMEVCHQPVDTLEAVSRRDENIGVTFKRGNGSIFAGRAFQQPQ